MAGNKGDDDLYAVPPADFVRARDAMVARLRKSGRAAQAVEVARLRKPTPVVWAANRLAREDPDGLRRFLDAIDRLKRAQLRDPRAVGEAAGDERTARQQLLDRASAILAEPGAQPSPAALRRLTATLLGAAADPALRGALRRGKLTAEYQAPGFDAFAGARPSPALRAVPRRDVAAARPATAESSKSAPARDSGSTGSRPDGRERRASREAVRRATTETRGLRRRAHMLERAAGTHRRAADRAARAVEALRTRLAKLEQRAMAERQEADRAAQESARLREEADRTTRPSS